MIKTDFTNVEKLNELVNNSPIPNQAKLPLVSVCIPAYNSEVTLARTLDSVLAQDYPRLDIVVSDNQSTDGTKAIVQQYVERSVRYCWHSEGRPSWAETLDSYIGVFANWDFVLSQGRGEYLCLFHSDDEYEPSIVRQQVDVMQAHPNVGAVFTRMRMIGEDSHPIQLGTSIIPDEVLGRTTFDFTTLLNAVLAHFNFLATPSVMIRRSVIEQVGVFDGRQFLTSADLEMWLRIAYQGYEIAIIEQPLLKYRISQRQGGSQYNKLRTTSADFYGVLDHYLSQPGVRAMVRPQSLALYELGRTTDQVRCAMHLLIQEKTAEARVLLGKSLRWRHFITALRRPRRLARLLIGSGLLVSIWLGLGIVVGGCLYQAYQRDLRRRQSPIKGK